jgi:hypothetical protein
MRKALLIALRVAGAAERPRGPAWRGFIDINIGYGSSMPEIAMAGFSGINI